MLICFYKFRGWFYFWEIKNTQSLKGWSHVFFFLLLLYLPKWRICQWRYRKALIVVDPGSCGSQHLPVRVVVVGSFSLASNWPWSVAVACCCGAGVAPWAQSRFGASHRSSRSEKRQFFQCSFTFTAFVYLRERRT